MWKLDHIPNMKQIMKKSQFKLSMSLNFKTINLTLEYHEVLHTIVPLQICALVP